MKQLTKTKINKMCQVDFIEENDILFDFKTQRPCQIVNGVLIIGDGGVEVEPYILEVYDIHYFCLETDGVAQ